MTITSGFAPRVLGLGLVLPKPKPEPYPLPASLGPPCMAYACDRNPAASILPPMALRRLGRAQQMALAASDRALFDSGTSIEQRSEIAVCLGTGLGELGNTYAFLENMISLDEEQPKPAAFINSVHNAIAGQLAIQLGCKGENHTFLNGPCSFESAVWQGIHLLESGRAERVLVCGVDELNGYTVGANRGLKLYRDGAEPLTPLLAHPHRQMGTLPGEGAAAIVIERGDSAHNSSHPIIATWCTEADLGDSGSIDPARAMDGLTKVLAQAGLNARGLDFIICNANGDSALDDAYIQVHRLLEGVAGRSLAIGAFKGATGDFDAASAVGVGLCIETLRRNENPAVVRWLGAHPPKDSAVGLFYNLNSTSSRGVTLVRA